MKSIIIASALVLGASPALAGPYLNVEANSGFTGSDYSGTSTDFHIGAEETFDQLSVYIQGGPTLFSPDGGEAETKFTGKAGGSVSVSPALSVYGELSMKADKVNSYGTKAGLKYSF
jgi:hypothetical protein